ncbi:MarR family winged helix-turn-helix transcriptional regulator [Leptospira perolatii]|nr:MarR family winged helix-turn-helix transcriptional regulator [Leptospira perolatii]
MSREEILQTLHWTMRELGSISVLISQAVADIVGINSSDMESADFLNIHGPMCAGKLAERTGLTSGAVTGMIDRLEKANLAKRVADPKDRRKVLIMPLPDRGQEIGCHFESFGMAVQNTLSQFSDEDLIKFLNICKALVAVSGEELKKLRTKEEKHHKPEEKKFTPKT